MAGTGPLSKQQHQRERDTKRRQRETAVVDDDGVLDDSERSPRIATLCGGWPE